LARETLEIGVVVERRRLNNPWADHAWMPVAVLAGAPRAEPWTVLDETPEATRFYLGSHQLEFFSSDTGGYRDNLRSGRPSIWVALAPADAEPGIALQTVTADPAEGEAFTESGAYTVEAVPMAPEIQARLAQFVAAHHVERAFFKRRRDRADTEALAVHKGRAHEGRE
jgi:hypothetical protein